MEQKATFLNNGNVKIENLDNRAMMTSSWRNFAGIVRAGHQYDRAGEPYFNISLAPDIYEALKNDGWDVQEWTSKSADPDAEPTLYLKVTVDMPNPDREWNRPSKIWYVTDPDREGRRRKILIDPSSDTFKDLDNAIFEEVDITLRGWTNKKGFKKAYLETMYYVIAKDEWADKWGDLEDADMPEGDGEEIPFA